MYFGQPVLSHFWLKTQHLVLLTDGGKRASFQNIVF
jgi:hypothetical protein